MNALSQDRVLRVRRYWKAAAECDQNVIGELVSDDVFRFGPILSPFDGVRGRENYISHVRKIQDHLSTYRNIEHDLIASEDGRRAYLHCTEWDGVGDIEIEAPLVLIFDFTDDGLISKIDIFWKSTADPALYNKFVEFLCGFQQQ
jgi:hypothetical protein